jgi:hypothetical protein
MLVHFGWYVARLAGGDIIMSYRGNIEIESKDGHYGKHDFEDDIDSKEKAWIILACALCLALAFTSGKLGFPLLYLVTSPELLVYNRIRKLKSNSPSCSTMVLSTR